MVKRIQLNLLDLNQDWYKIDFLKKNSVITSCRKTSLPNKTMGLAMSTNNFDWDITSSTFRFQHKDRSDVASLIVGDWCIVENYIVLLVRSFEDIDDQMLLNEEWKIHTIDTTQGPDYKVSVVSIEKGFLKMRKPTCVMKDFLSSPETFLVKVKEFTSLDGETTLFDVLKEEADHLRDDLWRHHVLA